MHTMESLSAIATGSGWWEGVIWLALKWPESHGIIPHGDQRRWDWGVTLKTLSAAMQHHERIARIAKSLTPAEREQLWYEDNETARMMRKVLTCP